MAELVRNRRRGDRMMKQQYQAEHNRERGECDHAPCGLSRESLRVRLNPGTPRYGEHDEQQGKRQLDEVAPTEPNRIVKGQERAEEVEEKHARDPSRMR